MMSVAYFTALSFALVLFASPVFAATLVCQPFEDIETGAKYENITETKINFAAVPVPGAQFVISLVKDGCLEERAVEDTDLPEDTAGEISYYVEGFDVNGFVKVVDGDLQSALLFLDADDRAYSTDCTVE